MIPPSVCFLVRRISGNVAGVSPPCAPLVRHKGVPPADTMIYAGGLYPAMADLSRWIEVKMCEQIKLPTTPPAQSAIANRNAALVVPVMYPPVTLVTPQGAVSGQASFPGQ